MWRDKRKVKRSHDNQAGTGWVLVIVGFLVLIALFWLSQGCGQQTITPDLSADTLATDMSTDISQEAIQPVYPDMEIPVDMTFSEPWT